MKITQLNIKTTKILLFVINKAFNKEIAAQLTPYISCYWSFTPLHNISVHVVSEVTEI